MDPISGLIGIGSSLLGGLFGNSERDQEYERQKEFAQSGIQWKVADARAAGISPLAALGAQTYSYAPQSVGESMSSAVADMGQDVSRAIDTTRTAPQRQQAVAKTMEDLQIKRMGLENELLASKIATIRQAGNPPAFPVVDGPNVLGLPQGTWKTGASANEQRIEDEYGDLVGNGYGIWRLGTDAFNAARPYWNNFVRSIPTDREILKGGMYRLGTEAGSSIR